MTRRNQRERCASWRIGCPAKSLTLSASVLLSVSLVAGSLNQPLYAQSGARNDNVGPVCMARTINEMPPFAIILPATDAEAMKSKGFQMQPCRESFATPKQREAWRDSICELAALPLETMQEQYAQLWGERPQVLCGMAEMATSQWRKGGKRVQ